MLRSELREVYCARTVPEASLVQQTLESLGIRAQLVNTSLQNAVGDLPYLAVAPRVWVLASDYDTAKQLIAQRFRDGSSPSEDDCEWVCPRCAEENGPAFEICWKCRLPRPDAIND